jgi:hypothetical protein
MTHHVAGLTTPHRRPARPFHRLPRALPWLLVAALSVLVLMPEESRVLALSLALAAAGLVGLAVSAVAWLRSLGPRAVVWEIRLAPTRS